MSESELKQIHTLLETPFWPQTIQSGKLYLRYEDDSPEGSLSVSFDVDGDGYIRVYQNIDPTEHNWSLRFRILMSGGGESPRVRNALLILAEAIRLDNEERPQNRP